MSIKKYTNIDLINENIDNEGKLLQTDDLFIVSKNEIEETDFGECKYDVMEVSIYDINNNILPQNSGEFVSYLKSNSIKNYLYKITNKLGQKELAINVEKLLKDLGYSNGIFKVNINFVKNKIGSDNQFEKVWIQEISPSREEIRIVPLKTKDKNINKTINTQFDNLQNQLKEFSFFKNNILNTLNSFDNNFLDKIDDILKNKFGDDFFIVLKKDFGLSKFSNLKTNILNNFKESVNYYLNNKYYKINDSNFGKPSELRFEDCEYYDDERVIAEIQKILFDCVSFNLQSLKRRDVTITNVPQEYKVIELEKQIKDNLESFTTPYELKTNYYSPDKINVKLNDDLTKIKISEPKDSNDPVRGVLLSTFCNGVDKYGKYADGVGGSYNELIESNSTECGYTPPQPTPEPVLTGGGGGGGTYRDRLYEESAYRDYNQK